jgi:hypothetical protein
LPWCVKSRREQSDNSASLTVALGTAFNAPNGSS